MIINEVIGGLNHIASLIGNMSSAYVSRRLEHSGPPQDDRPSKRAERLPTNNKPKVPKPLPDDQTQAWEHPKVSTDQRTTHAQLRKAISQERYESIVRERNINLESEESFNTKRRNPPPPKKP